MKRLLAILSLIACCATLATAQTNKRIRDLENRRTTLQKQLEENETLLNSTRRDVTSQLQDLQALTGQIAERRRYIETIGSELQALDSEMVSLDRQLASLQVALADKQKKYEASMRHLYLNRGIQDKLMFIFSADNLAQTYRRLRYVRQYATYQRLQADELKRKQTQIDQARTQTQEVRDEKSRLLIEREAEAAKLAQRENERRQLVSSLQTKQRSLQNEIAKQKREASKLNDEIDRQIALEIERARKQAEEEARREAQAKAEADRKAAASAAAKTQSATTAAATSANKSGTTASKSSSGSKSASASDGAYTMSKADRELSSDFSKNRGRLPMPITGPYIITSHYGQYSVEGLRNVTLDNKGINIQGKQGAQARAVFGGKVAAVFQLNGLFNILVRHGSYISVYCNLQNTAVRQGDEVKTKQILGTVFADAANGGRTILHFQLRREKEKLNPEVWLNK